MRPRKGRTNSWAGIKPGDNNANSPGSPVGQRPATYANAIAYFANGGLLSPQRQLQIHPWLDGAAPSSIFHFDLGPMSFTPLRLAATGPPQGVLLGAVEIRQPAFHPPRTALRILTPGLAYWPIDLALPAGLAAADVPPIALGDVLVAVHRAMHLRVTQAELSALAGECTRGVRKAFKERCRAEALVSGVPQAELREKEGALRDLGVRRVDFLLGKTVFKGLVCVPGDPEGCVRMVMA